MASSAHAGPGFRLVLVQPENAELVTRVEGQTRDLGVRLEVAPAHAGSGLSAEQAAAIAAERGADFVARVERTAEAGLEVRVYAAGPKKLRTREVASRTRTDRLGNSAQLEAAALVLRGELSTLIEAEREAAAASAAVGGAAGGSASGTGTTGARAGASAVNGTGTSGAGTAVAAAASSRAGGEAQALEREAKPSSEDTEDAEPSDADDAPDEAEAEPDDAPGAPSDNASARAAAWTLRAGVRASLPVNSQPAGALLLGVRARVAVVELGLAFSTALPNEIADENVQISVRRHTLSAEALGAVPLGPRLRALFGVEAGVVLDARTTDRVESGFTAAGSSSGWSATLGVLAELHWLITPQLGAALGAGLAYLPQRTRFAYTGSSSQDLEIAELRSLEPHASLCVLGRFGN